MQTETFNYIEAFLWGTIGVGFLVAAGVRERHRVDCVLVAAAFVAFGASDFVEVRTGAWWRPWWLLVWKSACLAVMVDQLRRHLRRRKRAS